jgi:CRP/FNR family cyclic AMP-dependent transcriptional regulator
VESDSCVGAGSRQSVPGSRSDLTVPELISIVDADPELGDLLPEDEREDARHQAITRVNQLSVGVWDAAGSVVPDVHHRGFLIIEGLISREVEVLGRRCVELLGEGDVMRPWQWDPDGAHVHAEVGWVVLEPARLAVLDNGLVQRMNPWPQLGVELFARGTRRAHALAVALAIAHHQRVEDRLRLTLWHLADRWGRVAPDGVLLPLPLSHERLAHLVGAQRPSVTTAAGVLTSAGELSRRPSGEWILHGSVPAQLRRQQQTAVLT